MGLFFWFWGLLLIILVQSPCKKKTVSSWFEELSISGSCSWIRVNEVWDKAFDSKIDLTCTPHLWSQTLRRENSDCKPGGRCLVFMVVEGGSINPSHWQINRADPRDRPRSAPWLSWSLSPGNHSVLLVFLSGRRVGFCLLCFTARNKKTQVELHYRWGHHTTVGSVWTWSYKVRSYLIISTHCFITHKTFLSSR